MEFQYETSATIKTKIQERPVAILPVGAVEAHGAHLPLATDNILADQMSKKLAEKSPAMVLPTLPFGQVWSLKDFPGSLTVSNESLISMLVDIGESLYRQGFKMFVMMNGHLGNAVALKEAARVLYDKHPTLKVFYFFYPGMKETVPQIRESISPHSNYFHACEIETSYMLYLAKEFVDMNKAIDDMPTIPDTADVTPTPWQDFTTTAVLGDATLATEEKGRFVIEHSLDIMANLVAAALNEKEEN
ncbi:creatininase family protein [Aureibacillus halotolerans]|uniref:Creatinine amidohydrolase n=1 Tax=Aureibacillus halotolerans TaxID=1508390 RepID=A0A4R6UAB8_9BACI|nr:creatininase family protein [Aureibacillus halotolerans]TDQ42802.1 creatinine amidohydrolase [Aureibacillus halotolerans]